MLMYTIHCSRAFSLLALAKSQPAMKRKATGESFDQTPTPRPRAQQRLRWVIQRWAGPGIGWVTGHSGLSRCFHQARLVLEALEKRPIEDISVLEEEVPLRISLCWRECAEED